MEKQLPSIGLQNLRRSENYKNQNQSMSSRLPNRVENHKNSEYPSTSNPLSYSERFHHVSKISNYNNMTDPEIWKEYEKLRKNLKILNEQILFEIQKKAVKGIKIPEVKQKNNQQKMKILQEEKKMLDGIIKSKKQQLEAHENRYKVLSKENAKDILETELEEITQLMEKIKNENREMEKKSRMLSKQLINAPQLLQKMFGLEDQLHISEKKLANIKLRIKDTQKQLNQSIQKLNEITKAISSRKQQYSIAQRYVEQEINVSNYQELCANRDTLKKYESPYKRNYLQKLKELESLINNIHHKQVVITESEKNIFNIRVEIESINNILLQKRKDNNKPFEKKKKILETDKKRNSSMMTMRNEDDKNIEDSSSKDMIIQQQQTKQV